MKDNPFIELLVTLLLLITVIIGGSLYQKHKENLDSTPARTELKVGKIEDIPKQDIRKDKQKMVEENIKLTFAQAVKRTE